MEESNIFLAHTEVSNYICYKYRQIENGLLTIALIGQALGGKSSFLNALIGATIKSTSVGSYTKETEFHIKEVEFYDLPGLGESTDTDKTYLKSYQDKIGNSDVIIWGIHSDNRPVAQIFAKDARSTEFLPPFKEGRMLLRNKDNYLCDFFLKPCEDKISSKTFRSKSLSINDEDIENYDHFIYFRSLMNALGFDLMRSVKRIFGYVAFLGSPYQTVHANFEEPPDENNHNINLSDNKFFAVSAAGSLQANLFH